MALGSHPVGIGSDATPVSGANLCLPCHAISQSGPRRQGPDNPLIFTVWVRSELVHLTG